MPSLDSVPSSWVYRPTDPEVSGLLSRQLQITPVVAELLARGGFNTPEKANAFLNPRLADIDDPFRIPNLQAAAHRLAMAIERKESVVILGDYDVDGVSSTTLLVAILRRFGLAPRYIVPLRLEEGYGLSRSAIDRALDVDVPSLFIALDCGTNSHDEAAYLRSRGVDVLIVDHHRSKEGTPPGVLLINPHVAPASASGTDPQWQYLCTVGLVFKLVHGLLKLLRASGHPEASQVKLRDYLDLVALGTVADLVPLRDENRTLARHGLSVLKTTTRPGLIALMEVSGIDRAFGIQPVDISFRLGPRINASGRLADASLSVDLMLSNDMTACRAAALQLDSFNRERQEIERSITERAEQQIVRQFLTANSAVLFDTDWHPGVVGIVASRVSRKFNRACIVLGREGEIAKGSGRSVFGINLVEALAECADLLTSWGGHPLAVGVALHQKNLEAFRQRFEAAITRRLGTTATDHALDISAWVDLDSVDEVLMKEIELLHPFGQGNPQPVFALRAVSLVRRDVFKEQHFRFQLEDSSGRRLYGVAWKMADRLPPVGQPIDLAFELVWNYFNGRKFLQIDLLDWRETTP